MNDVTLLRMAMRLKDRMSVCTPEWARGGRLEIGPTNLVLFRKGNGIVTRDRAGKLVCEQQVHAAVDPLAFDDPELAWERVAEHFDWNALDWPGRDAPRDVADE